MEPTLKRVSAPLREQVTDLLRADIVSSTLAPGTRLVESALCARFGVSRPVVREALRQLDAEGLVATIPNQGTVVASLTLEDARELYEVRASLEGLAGELFTLRATDEERAALQRSYDEMATSFVQPNLYKQLVSKDEFYDVLFTGARNSVIRSTLLGIHARVQMLRGISMKAPGRPERSLAELKDVVDAAVTGDAEAARVACQLHVRNAADIALAELRARTPEPA